jgi:hypothetical protein
MAYGHKFGQRISGVCRPLFTTMFCLISIDLVHEHIWYKMHVSTLLSPSIFPRESHANYPVRHLLRRHARFM